MKSTAKDMKDSMIGLYLGAAIGDALGAPQEFIAPYAVEPIDKYETGGAHDVDIGEWTDDTAMARCITDCYLQLGHLDGALVNQNFSTWHSTGYFGTRGYCFDIGATCGDGIRAWDRYQAIYSTTDQDADGNGGMMRMAPCLVRHAFNPQAARMDAVVQSMYTHGGREQATLIDHLVRQIFDGMLDNEQDPYYYDHLEVTNGGWIRETYMAVKHAVMNSDTFEEAVLTAVNGGRDADTVGCITGMVYGSLVGLSGLPSHLLEGLMMKDVLLAEAEQLFEMAEGEKTHA